MDRDELARLYQEYSDGVYGYLSRLTGSEDQAFDLLQDVFIRVARFQGGVQYEKAWLYRIARNLAYDYFRRNREIPAGEDYEAPVADSFTGDVDWSELRVRILERLGAESETFQQIFLLRLDHEMTHADIAGVTGLGERTVRRNFEKIKRILSREFHEELFGGRRAP